MNPPTTPRGADGGTVRLGTRFWVNAALGTLAAVLAVGTLAWPHWIELAFGVDPDGNTGWLEWAIVAAAAVASAVFSAVARIDWRRTAAERLRLAGGGPAAVPS